MKQAPGRPSPSAMQKLTHKIESIEATSVSDLDLSWLNNNLQLSLVRHAKRCTSSRLRKLQTEHRCAVLICFLQQTYYEAVDNIVDMYEKLINRIYNHAQNDIDNYTKSQHKKLRQSLTTFKTLAELILDSSIDDSTLRRKLFRKVEKEALVTQVENIETWLTGKYSHLFNLIVKRFSYIRQFFPSLLKYIQLQSECDGSSSLFNAIDILQEINDNNKRKLPDDVPIDFIPKKIHSLMKKDGKVNKPAWECALLTVIRVEIKSGNVSVKKSK